MNEHHTYWRIEQFMDETDPFGTPVWYVMEGEILIAQSEIRTVAEKLLQVYEERHRFHAALQQIVAVQEDHHESPREIARRALDREG